eukprot:TRINITY_DN39973_c0_g1_i1.p1 TRINITY_DN39973_c0_g1~~TRINITY_DN39973_c0_g1_i1.p1  ORF type:complete len:626 (+),score=95.85 TRINITY_DN39973_c0_g1_i1:131-2008(+)
MLSPNGMSVAECVVEGGDDRLTVLKDICMNKYNVPNVPTKGICRGSCTSSMPSAKAFACGESVLEMINSGHALDLAKDLRERLQTVWELKSSTSLTFFPSGTDVEFMFLLLALGRCFENGGKGSVLSVVTCAGEVGSATKDAAGGRHISTTLPSGHGAKAGASIFGGQELPVEAVEVKLREPSGKLRASASVDSEIEGLVTEALESNHHEVCVVHLVAGCKTGHASPSLQVMDRLSARFGKRVIPLFDGCQVRLRDGTIRDFVERGYGVMVTGSKFYGGPPFCGAALLNEELTAEFNQLLTSKKLADLIRESELREYLCASLIDVDRLPSLHQLMSDNRSIERGTLLRWAMAAIHIEDFHQIPSSSRDNLMATWVSCVEDIIDKFNSPVVSVLKEEADLCPSFAGVLPVNTIVSLRCRVKSNGVWRDPNIDELRHVHRLMALDLSDWCASRGGVAAEELSKRCFIAQPVALGKDHPPVLRVAIGARQICDAFGRCLKETLAATGDVSWSTTDDEVVVRKLARLLEEWDIWSSALAAKPSVADMVKYEFNRWDQQVLGTITVRHFTSMLRTIGLDAFAADSYERLFRSFLQAEEGDINDLEVEYEPMIDFILRNPKLDTRNRRAAL